MLTATPVSARRGEEGGDTGGRQRENDPALKNDAVSYGKITEMNK